MLVRVTDAEGVVQDAWLRWTGAADRVAVREPCVHLVRVITRLAMDWLRQVRARGETHLSGPVPSPTPCASWTS
ncbi:hypothetical protein LK08_17875 [Streptomyces sp. MUSC 125]|nr:hypothetical protein LK08_17875 [Streptomyces sp. MUSC 125]